MSWLGVVDVEITIIVIILFMTMIVYYYYYCASMQWGRERATAGVWRSDNCVESGLSFHFYVGSWGLNPGSPALRSNYLN